MRLTAYPPPPSPASVATATSCLPRHRRGHLPVLLPFRAAARRSLTLRPPPPLRNSVPNPLCDNFEMFEFVGRLMAACILSEERLVVNLPVRGRRGAPLFLKA